MQPLKPKGKSIVLLDCQNPKGLQFHWLTYQSQPVVSVKVSIQFHSYPVNEGHSETANEINRRQRAKFCLPTLRQSTKQAPKRTELTQVASKNETNGNGQVLAIVQPEANVEVL